MKDKDLSSLFHEGLKDVYYAERKILRALPKMARAAQSETLRAAFLKHKDETETQKERLDQVFEAIDKRAQGKTCPAIDGILEEGEEIIDQYKGMAAIDAGLLAAAQAVEHYEIARYTTLANWAKLLGHNDAVTLLAETLAEEEATDKALSQLAKVEVNKSAMAA